jgi:hypothetical protein
MGYVSGGEKLKKFLDKISVGNANKYLNVGFLENSIHPGSDIPTAQIAFWQEFGAIVDNEARQQSVYRNIDKEGNFKRNGKFAKKNAANFETTHSVGASKTIIPARPFFRTAIELNQQKWVDMAKKMLADGNYDTGSILSKIGSVIKNDIQDSIRTFNSPPNAPSTIAKKGFDNPLIETGFMLNSVDFEIDSHSGEESGT